MDLETTHDDEIEIDLRALFIHLKHFWYLLLGGAIIGLIIAEAYLLLLEVPQYQSTSMIYIRGSSTSVSLQDLQIGSELTNDYEVIITSRPLMEEVIEKYNLDMSYKQLQGHISISNPTDTRILQIAVTTDDAELSKDIANEVANLGMDSIKEIDAKEPYLVESAVTNTTKVNRSNKITMVMGFVGGLLVVAAGLFIEFIMNDKLKALDDIEKSLGVPVLTTVAEVKEVKHKSSRGGL